jgi:hypothetical protein
MNLARAARSTVLALAALGVATWVGGGRLPDAVAGTLSQKHRDAAHKFSFSYFDDWIPVPQRPGETDVVAAYVQSGAEARGTMPVRLTMLRTGPDDAVTTPSEGPPPKDPRGGPEKKRPDDVFGLWKERLQDWGQKPVPILAAAKPIESRDDVPGRLWVHVTSPVEGRGWGGELFHLFASWRKPDGTVEYGMWITCASSQRKKLEPLLRQVVSSFTWFDAKAKDVKTIEALSGVNITPARRRSIERGLVKGWGVVVSPKRNYVVIYNTKGRRNDALARLIAERVEMIREQIYERNFPPAKPFDDVAIVRVCGDRAEYHAYGGPGGSAGYWSPGTEELVFYDASPATKVDDDTIAVLYHEAFHQYIYYSAGRVAPHSWFDEGHGDYYAGAKLSGGKFTIRPFSWRVGTIKGAINAGPSPRDEQGRWDRRREGYTPLPDFTAFSQRDYYSYPGVSYAQGWSLVYFLREIVPTKPAWNAKWGKILDTYFTTLRGSIPPPKKPTPAPDPAKKGPDGKAPEPAAPSTAPSTTPSPAPAAPAPPADPAVPRYEFEAVYAIPWLVPDALFAEAWKEFPAEQPTEKAAWARFQAGVGLTYVVAEGEAQETPIDPRDPERGFAAFVRKDFVAAGLLPEGATGWPVPAAASFGDRAAAPPAGTPDLPDPAADPRYRTYLEKGWRLVALRDQFFANLLDRMLRAARSAPSPAAGAAPVEPKTFSTQLAAMAALQPSIDDAAKGARFLRLFVTKPGEPLDRKQVESLPELGSYALSGYLSVLDPGSYDAVHRSLRAGEILVALRLGGGAATGDATEPADAKPPADDAKPEDAKGFVPPPTYGGDGGDLKKALEAAFKGVDWKELEAAWKSSIESVGAR